MDLVTRSSRSTFALHHRRTPRAAVLPEFRISRSNDVGPASPGTIKASTYGRLASWESFAACLLAVIAAWLEALLAFIVSTPTVPAHAAVARSPIDVTISTAVAIEAMFQPKITIAPAFTAEIPNAPMPVHRMRVGHREPFPISEGSISSVKSYALSARHDLHVSSTATVGSLVSLLVSLCGVEHLDTEVPILGTEPAQSIRFDDVDRGRKLQSCLRVPRGADLANMHIELPSRRL